MAEQFSLPRDRNYISDIFLLVCQPFDRNLSFIIKFYLGTISVRFSLPKLLFAFEDKTFYRHNEELLENVNPGYSSLLCLLRCIGPCFFSVYNDNSKLETTFQKNRFLLFFFFFHKDECTHYR